MRPDVFQERPSSRVRSGRSRRRDVPSTRPAGRRRLLAVEQLEGRTLLTDVTPFTPRFSTDTNGDIAIVANTLMTVSSNNPDAANIQAGVNNPSGVDNNNLDMVYVNDGLQPHNNVRLQFSPTQPAAGSHRTLRRLVLGRRLGYWFFI